MAALPLMAGVLLNPRMPPAPLLYASLPLFFSIIAIIGRGKPWVSMPALAAALLFAGLAAAQLERFYFAPHDIANDLSDDAVIAEMELLLVEEPRIASNPMVEFNPPLPKQVALAHVCKINTNHGWVDATGAVLLRVSPPNTRLSIGQMIRCAGHLSRPSPAMNPGQFDWAEHYRQNRILAFFDSPHASSIKVVHDPGPRWDQTLAARTRLLLEEGFRGRDGVEHAFLRSLLLGDRDPQIRATSLAFLQTGANHLLSTSGLHLAILGALLMLAGRLMFLGPALAASIALGFVLLYGIAVFPSVAATRSVIICLAFGIALLIRLRADRINLLAACAIVMLVYHPLDINGPGFQLTFIVVLAILLTLKPALQFIRDQADFDLKVAMIFRPPPWHHRLWLNLKERFWSYLALALFAWLASAPLVAWHFEQMNPWAILAGLILFPLVIAALCGGAVKILLTLLLPSLAHTWAAIAAMPVRWLLELNDLLARLPGAAVPFPVPPIWTIFAWYFLLAVGLYLLHRSRQIKIDQQSPAAARQRRAQQWLRIAAAIALALLLLLPLAALHRPHYSDDETRITLLAIGAGQIGVVELPDTVLLIDDGSSTMSDPLHTVLQPFLRHERRRRVDRIFLSHPDFDHISAAAGTITAFDTRDIYVHPFFADQSQHNHPAKALLSQLKGAGLSSHLVHRGDHLQIDADNSLDVIWPPADHAFSTTNEAGLVLRLTSHGRSILFPADIQSATENELLLQTGMLKSDVLVAPHHGSAESTTDAFVHAVNPQWIVASNRAPLTHKQISFDELASDRPLFRTNRCGAITIHISHTGELRIETFLRGGTAGPESNEVSD